MADNLVSQPPLMTPVTDANGNISKAWAIWFRDLYRRVAFKGGNAIDDNADAIDGTIDTLEETIIQVLKNVVDIAQNADDIEQNQSDIATNAQNTLNLENRAIGQARPAAYQESGASYAVGDLVVYPATDPQLIYQADAVIADPAGAFDVTKWVEKSLRNSVDIEAYLQLTPIKAAHFAFTGRATDGAATISYSFNVASVTRNGVGVYDVVLSQQTFYGVNVLDKANPMLGYDIAPVAATEAFHIEYSKTGANTFTIEVYEWIQGAGNKIDLVPFDPVGVNDLVFVTLLTDISNAGTPPP